MGLPRRTFLLGGTLTVLAAALPMSPGSAAGQNYAPGSLDAYFRFEWKKTGRTISGYVYNTSNRWAARMQLVVESVDRSGKVVAKTTTWVLGGVPPNGRAFFEASSVREAASYQVRVLSFEWTERRDLRSW